MFADERIHDPICAAAKVLAVKIVSRLIARCLAGIRQLGVTEYRSAMRQSQNGKLLIASDHSDSHGLAHRAHRLGAERGAREVLGAVIAAFTQEHNMFAVADWRRRTAHGYVNED
jgi:hypothetical protein